GLCVERNASRSDLLSGIREPALRVVNIAEDRESAGAPERRRLRGRRRGALVLEQAMAALGVAVVDNIVAGQPEENAVRRDQFQAGAAGEDVLVVVAEAGGEVLAEPAVAEARTSNPE